MPCMSQYFVTRWHWVKYFLCHFIWECAGAILFFSGSNNHQHHLPGHINWLVDATTDWHDFIYQKDEEPPHFPQSCLQASKPWVAKQMVCESNRYMTMLSWNGLQALLIWYFVTSFFEGASRHCLCATINNQWWRLEMLHNSRSHFHHTGNSALNVAGVGISCQRQLCHMWGSYWVPVNLE